MKSWQCVVMLLVAVLCGCSMNTAGSEAGARKYFDAEFKKWMAGQENTVSTMQSRIGVLSNVYYRKIAIDERIGKTKECDGDKHKLPLYDGPGQGYP